MSYTVKLSARAERDIKEAYAYIREHGPASPNTWKAGLERKLVSLESFPEAYGFAPENTVTHTGIHQLLYGPFRILYVIRDNDVDVLTVRHGARRFLREDELD